MPKTDILTFFLYKIVQTCQELYLYLTYVLEKIHRFNGLVITWFYNFCSVFYFNNVATSRRGTNSYFSILWLKDRIEEDTVYFSKRNKNILIINPCNEKEKTDRILRKILDSQVSVEYPQNSKDVHSAEFISIFAVICL